MRYLIYCFLITGILLTVGCEKLDENGAAELACALANKKCQASFDEQPFKPDSYEPEFKKGRWYWGHFEPRGIKGYSADVSFKANGSDPEVYIALTTDVNDLGNPKLFKNRKNREKELERLKEIQDQP